MGFHCPTFCTVNIRLIWAPARHEAWATQATGFTFLSFVEERMHRLTRSLRMWKVEWWAVILRIALSGARITIVNLLINGLGPTEGLSGL